MRRTISEGEPGGRRQTHLLSSPTQRKQSLPSDRQPTKRERENRAIVRRSSGRIKQGWLSVLLTETCILTGVWPTHRRRQWRWSSSSNLHIPRCSDIARTFPCISTFCLVYNYHSVPSITNLTAHQRYPFPELSSMSTPKYIWVTQNF